MSNLRSSLNRVAKLFKQWRCKHGFKSNTVTVSGYGYTEYQVWFCCLCDKSFIKQTREQR